MKSYTEFEISVKKKRKSAELFTLKTSQSVADFCRQIFDADTIDWVESMVIIGVNKMLRQTGVYQLSKGGLTGTVADPRVIMLFAVESMATGIILCHNHPSGSLTPSSADLVTTKKVKEALSYIDVQLHDHIILSDAGFFSFTDNALL